MANEWRFVSTVADECGNYMQLSAFFLSKVARGLKATRGGNIKAWVNFIDDGLEGIPTRLKGV
ncbi:hypothetical protein SESBI_00494 [Sesbania bispinosa]|nr:hypothetical protein SESBI_00494 [Sesbania bispinosa]